MHVLLLPTPTPPPPPAAPGTVLDTMGLHWTAWRQLAKEYGFELSVQKLLSLAGELRELLAQRTPIPGCFRPSKVPAWLPAAPVWHPGGFHSMIEMPCPHGLYPTCRQAHQGNPGAAL